MTSDLTWCYCPRPEVLPKQDVSLLVRLAPPKAWRVLGLGFVLDHWACLGYSGTGKRHKLVALKERGRDKDRPKGWVRNVGERISLRVG